MATKYTYTKAVEYCSNLGAILATPRTAAENTCAKDVAAAAGAYKFWLGYRGSNTAGSFVGADGGDAMSYANWNTPGEPGLTDADNCVILDAGNGLWRDESCGSGFDVICQAQN